MVKILPAMQETWVLSWVEKVHWRRKQQPTPEFLPEDSHGQRSLAGYSPWSPKESDRTEQLGTHTHTHTHTKHHFGALPLYSKESINAGQYYCSSSEHIFFLGNIKCLHLVWHSNRLYGNVSEVEKKQHCPWRINKEIFPCSEIPRGRFGNALESECNQHRSWLFLHLGRQVLSPLMMIGLFILI